MPVDGARDVGRVEAAVRGEIAQLGEHGRQGIAEAAVTLGRLLDNPQAHAQWPAASRALQRLLESLRRDRVVRPGRLAAVRAMSSRRAPDAG